MEGQLALKESETEAAVDHSDLTTNLCSGTATAAGFTLAAVFLFLKKCRRASKQDSDNDFERV